MNSRLEEFRCLTSRLLSLYNLVLNHKSIERAFETLQSASLSREWFMGPTKKLERERQREIKVNSSYVQ